MTSSIAIGQRRERVLRSEATPMERPKLSSSRDGGFGSLGGFKSLLRHLDPIKV